MVNNEKPMTVKDAAEYLSISEYKVREYIRQGQLKAHKIGASNNIKGKHRWLIWKCDIVEFINRRSNQ